MPLVKLQFKPGINTEVTRYANEGGWYDGDKIRFRFGNPEKIGGWQTYSDSQIQGVCRKMHNWVALDRSDYLAVGTHLKFYVEEGTQFFDITPIRKSSTLSSGSLSATDTSAVVTITDNNHGAVTNDFITISNATTFAGIPADDLNKEHQVTVIDGSQYTITVATAATSTTTGGGTPTIEYQINTGLDTIISGTGWGAGLWSGRVASAVSTTLASDATDSDTTISLTDASSFPASGTVLINDELITYSGKSTNDLTGCTRGAQGTAAAAHTTGDTVTDATDMVGWGQAAEVSTVAGTEARIWSIDNFGEDLIFCPRDGALYYWDKSARTTSQRAQSLSDLADAEVAAARLASNEVPVIARQVLVSDRDRHVIAFACNQQGETDQDPLLIRYSNAENAYDWDITTVGSSAGDLLIGSGSKFITAVETKREILVWTDVSLHSLQFIGEPSTFGIVQIASGVSIVGPNAAVAVNDQVFWMGENKFYVYDGRTTQIPCTVRDHVFDNINKDQYELVTAALNSQFNEIWWFYPSEDSLENDRYVVFNYLENVWYFGTMGRTAWIDAEIRDYPIAASADGYLYNHEFGQNDGSQSPPGAISAYIESSPISIDTGDKFVMMNRMLPDVTFNGSVASQPTVTFTLTSYENPGSATLESVSGNVQKQLSATVEQFTDELFLRLRGRAFSVKISSDQTDIQWRLGVPRVDVRPDGRR